MEGQYLLEQRSNHLPRKTTGPSIDTRLAIAIPDVLLPLSLGPLPEWGSAMFQREGLLDPIAIHPAAKYAPTLSLVSSFPTERLTFPTPEDLSQAKGLLKNNLALSNSFPM
jgi:hypothetical protein